MNEFILSTVFEKFELVDVPNIKIDSMYSEEGYQRISVEDAEKGGKYEDLIRKFCMNDTGRMNSSGIGENEEASITDSEHGCNVKKNVFGTSTYMIAGKVFEFVQV